MLASSVRVACFELGLGASKGQFGNEVGTELGDLSRKVALLEMEIGTLREQLRFTREQQRDLARSVEAADARAPRRTGSRCLT